MSKAIVLIHGAWLNARRRDHVKARYEARGHTVLAPDWPLDGGDFAGGEFQQVNTAQNSP